MSEEAMTEAPAPASEGLSHENQQSNSIRDSVNKALDEAKVPDDDGVDVALKDNAPAEEEAEEKPVKADKKADEKKVEDKKADEKKADKKEEEKSAKNKDDTDDKASDEDGDEEEQSARSEDDTEDADSSDADDEEDDGFSEPPQRFSPDAKNAWREAPLPVRAEVNRAMEEMQAGIEKYRQDADDYAEFRDFHQTLKHNGQKFEDVMGHYIGIENMLKQDPISGLRIITQNMGIPLENIASHVLNQPLDQRTEYYVNTIRDMQGAVAALQTENNKLRQEAQAEALQMATGELDQFVAEHPEMQDSEFADWVAFFFKERAQTLEEAYDLAMRQTGKVPQPQAEPGEQDEKRTAQTRRGKSLKGAPNGSSGSNPAGKGGKLKPTRDILKSRMAQVGL